MYDYSRELLGSTKLAKCEKGVPTAKCGTHETVATSSSSASDELDDRPGAVVEDRTSGEDFHPNAISTTPAHNLQMNVVHLRDHDASALLSGANRNLFQRLPSSSSKKSRRPRQRKVSQKLWNGGNAFVKANGVDQTSNRWLIAGHERTISIYDLLPENPDDIDGKQFTLVPLPDDPDVDIEELESSDRWAVWRKVNRVVHHDQLLGIVFSVVQLGKKFRRSMLVTEIDEVFGEFEKE